MASIRSFPEAEGRQRAERQRRLASDKRSQWASGTTHGWPDWAGLIPVLGFLCVPAVLVLAITLTGTGWPRSILFPIAIVLGLYVAASTFRSLELVLACLLIYLPFSKVYVVPIAPGVNGTNMLLLLGLFAALLRVGDAGNKLNQWPRGSLLVAVFAVLTALSAVTITLIPGGRVFLVYQELLSYKAWIDQFIFYFIALMAIRDIETAKRCFIYLMLGAMLVVLYSVPEMLEKMGRSTIEKSRIGGPHLQSNNFGGFVAYTVLPLAAVFVVYIKDIRAWILAPYFLVTAKILITTFSRGAYVAMMVGAFLVAWFKGKRFLVAWSAVLLVTLMVFPVLIPESIVTRMQAVTTEDAGSSPTEERLDKSSSTRLVLWRAATAMIAEDPIWGKGFKGFQLLKEEYTEYPVKESDPHSMYLYIASQMGLPSMMLFVWILVFSFYLGRKLSTDSSDRFIRAIGIGGAAATACFAVVCIFGSRAVSLNFTVYFWSILAIMQVVRYEQQRQLAERSTESFLYQRSGGGLAAGTSLARADEPSLTQVVAVHRRGSGKNRRYRGPARGARALQRCKPAVAADKQQAATEQCDMVACDTLVTGTSATRLEPARLSAERAHDIRPGGSRRTQLSGKARASRRGARPRQ